MLIHDWQTIGSEHPAPYVYLIAANGILYIGETQDHPVKRWAGHLSSGGDFLRNVKAKTTFQPGDISSLWFYSLNCCFLSRYFSDQEIRRATQALEHQLHCEAVSNLELLGAPFVLVSDTEKTMPRRFRKWQLIEGIASSVFLAFCKRFQEGHDRRPEARIEARIDPGD